MEIRRFFVNSADVQDGKVIVTGDEFLHMTKVLRYKTGFKAIVCANDGKELACTVDEIQRDYALLNVDDVRVADRKNRAVTLYAGLLKNNKLDFVIQKGVELGVDRIVPFISDNCAEDKFNVERARRIALESAKQCGSAYLSEIGEVITFDEVLNKVKDCSCALFCYECEKQNRIADTLSDSGAVSLIVGAEGGFTSKEASLAKEAGCKTVTLGRRILRAETAAIVAAALTLDAMGELDYD